MNINNSIDEGIMNLMQIDFICFGNWIHALNKDKVFSCLFGFFQKNSVKLDGQEKSSPQRF